MENVTDGTFEEAVIKSPIPAAVFFKSVGCSFCARMTPTMEEIAIEYAGRLKILMMDVAEGMNTAVRYGVMSVPQALIFKDGKQVGEIRGWAPKADVVRKIESILQ